MTVTAEMRKHGHLIFIPLAWKSDQIRQERGWKGAQAGLRIAYPMSTDEVEDQASQRISKAASQRNFACEAPASQYGTAWSGQQRARNVDNIASGMLSVRVRSYKASKTGEYC